METVTFALRSWEVGRTGTFIITLLISTGVDGGKNVVVLVDIGCFRIQTTG